ncbi:hypothetical protein AKJ49_02130 [candidate division MSBL1 archaeon SCGC-AAA382A03]|uniref:Uncharacterized protein n=1 Tax=candidate division MSBL1 archaeon SCGC-AAA382A03 TaxID=1698278 RepID=A0A133VD79_9EURY|nr:hypothetical protein AKJ49_02130 [candidate division MSBL1 archaeon SCGC-AAA382A03]
MFYLWKKVVLLGDVLKHDRDRNSIRIVVTVLIIGAVLIGLYLLISEGNGETNGDGGGNGGGNGETITGIDFRLQGFEGGSLGGDARIRAVGIGTDSLKIRIDKVGAEDILILNYEENAEYAYTGTSWLKLPITQSSPYSGIPFEQWAQEGPGTYEYDYQNFSIKVTINEVNPSLQDNLFSAPENAKVKEVETE